MDFKPGDVYKGRLASRDCGQASLRSERAPHIESLPELNTSDAVSRREEAQDPSL